MPHFRLIGGHSAGRFVVLDDPLPLTLRVAYREPVDPFDPTALANETPDQITFGIETYDLVIFPRDGRGQGPTMRQYAYRETQSEPPVPPALRWSSHRS